MPRRRSISHDQLAAAALTVIDRDGLAGTSMRAVAKELGMSTMALYRYVEDRRELEGLVVELVLSAVDPERPPPGPSWRERLETMVLRMRDALAAHPEVVPLTAVHRHGSLSLLRWSETVVGLLTEGGIEGERRVIALRGMLSYVIGALQLEHLGPLSGEGTNVIASLPRDEFPGMAETAASARGVDPETEFRGGLALLLDGIESQSTG
ncbi:TetR/AcrR family transcriptional regulator C-terminal domain-containing protein [Actinomadura barringtoniae]|uniref:TetR/AcrR family transcriptional regulator C-terminal domain-containing protein n=1 Tax=Actinomadura barringtoniae TaxID=1427535 RepID=A0A939PGN7_9ACTN|nr:TetR/AcrR family transcriptional regulator [Actinomadura barringtoniae]MBO2449414.1 TetR/AcrR family transcriptional regulator C-terminal domain-containing protein [Actinomadura barringtoniae]